MKKNQCFLRGTLALIAATFPVHADYYWDGTDLTPDADGGAGVWDTTALNWDTLATGGTDTAWSPTENAIFGGLAGQVSVATGGITAANITFATDGYTVKDNTLSAGTGAITTAPATTATITSSITGTGGLTKAGAGTLVLNALNAYTGSTKISEGTLKLAAATNSFRYYRFSVTQNFGNGSTTQDGYNQLGEVHFYKNGAWVPATTGSFGSNPVLVGPGPEQNWALLNDNLGMDGVGTFTKFGIGNPTRPYWITYDYGSATMLESYNWSTGNDSTPARNPRKWTVQGSNDGTNFTVLDDKSLGNQVGPTATFTWSSPTGTFTANTNALTGGLATSYPIAPSPLPSASPIELASGATLDLNGVSHIAASLADLSGGGGTLTNTFARPVSFAYGNATSTSFSGVITDSGAGSALTFAKIGAGAMTLSGSASNSYSGGTIVGSNGKLILAKTGGATAIPAGTVSIASTAFVSNGTGLVLGGDHQIADAALVHFPNTSYGAATQNPSNSFFRLNGHTETIGGLTSEIIGGLMAVENGGNNDATAWPVANLTLNVTSGTPLSYGGVIRDKDAGSNAGAIAITKTGPGTQILAGTMSAWTGPLAVNEGVLRLNGTTASTTVAVTATGKLEGTGTISGSLAVNSGGIVSPGVAGAGTLTAVLPVSIGATGTLDSTTGTTLAGSVTVASSGLIRGTGAISGPVTVQAGGSLAPGNGGIGQLNLTNTVSLAGTTTLEINKTGATLTNDKINGFTGITYGGTLTIVPTGDTPVLGDSFVLFAPVNATTSFSGGFTSVTGLPPLAPGLQWDTSSLLRTGTITVIGTSSVPAITPFVGGGTGGFIGTVPVTITGDAGSTIFYTIDGTDPGPLNPNTISASSPITSITIPVDSVVTVKAYASTPTFTDSAITSMIFRTVTVPKWNVDAAGNWSLATNWLNQVIPSGSGVTANFTFPITVDRTVTVDSNRTVGNLVFGNTLAGKWTLARSASNILTLSVPTGTPGIEVQNVDTTISAVLAGTQGITKSGSGTLFLTGTNTYGGNTAITGGIVSVTTLAGNGTNSPLGAGSSLTLDGGTLRHTVAANIGAGTFNRNITLGAGGGTIDTGAFPGNFWFWTGVISGPGSLTKNGTRQVIIQSVNTYDGNTFVNAGELQVRTPTSLGSTLGKTVVASGANLALGQDFGNNTLLENIDINGNGPTPGLGGALQVNDGGFAGTYGGSITLVTNSGIGGAQPFSISGTISGPGALSKLLANAVTLSGATSNTYTGGTILAGSGKLVLAKTGGAIAIPGDISIAATANHVNGGNNSGVVLAGEEQIADSALLTWSVPFNTYFRLNGHTETIGGLVTTAGAPAASPAIENRGFGDTLVYPDGHLILNTAGSYSYTGVIRDTDPNVAAAGVVKITKTGSGTQTLAGTLSYTGATTVNGGTLALNSAAASPITVNTGATLKGTGSTSGALTVAFGGILAPGASAGTFGAGNTVFDGTYACEIDGATADRLTVTGDLDVAGGIVNFDVLNAPTAPSYIIASCTGTLTGVLEAIDTPEGYQVVHDPELKQIRLELILSGFAAYASENGLTGDPAADFDSDGLDDAIEYVLGTSPTADSSANAPAGSVVGGNLVFTFTRDDASLTEDVTIAVEVGTTLGTWPNVYDVGVDTASSDAGITVTDNGATDTITLTVPVGTDEKKFARLKVTVTPPTP